jgi:hypothetical protein
MFVPKIIAPSSVFNHQNYCALIFIRETVKAITNCLKFHLCLLFDNMIFVDVSEWFPTAFEIKVPKKKIKFS